MATYSTSSSPTPMRQMTDSSNGSVKPVKLRSACNHCFTAKVRCDGNKLGCRRCVEKSLFCGYSESKVGKVVGKRRKRPADEAIGKIDSEDWVLKQSSVPPSNPSPTATHLSDEQVKRQCSTSSWTSLISDSIEQDSVSMDDSMDMAQSIDLSDCRSVSWSSEMPFAIHSGLPTPALSPPQFRYLSPAALETRPVSQQTSATVDSSRLLPPRYLSPRPRTPESTQGEDEETICIKILAHLKKNCSVGILSRESQLNLVKKSNAAVGRILKSKNIRSNYVCQMLLSSIMSHLVGLCEELSSGKMEEMRQSHSSFLHEQLQFEPSRNYFDDGAGIIHYISEGDDLKFVIGETITLASTIADMLKKRPLEGFQMLGRHETLHMHLDQRLRQTLVGLE